MQQQIFKFFQYSMYRILLRCYTWMMQHSHKLSDLTPWHAASGCLMSLRLRWMPWGGPTTVCWVHSWPYFNAVEELLFQQSLSLIYRFGLKVITAGVCCQIKAKVVHTGCRWWTTGRGLIQRHHHSRYNHSCWKEKGKENSWKIFSKTFSKKYPMFSPLLNSPYNAPLLWIQIHYIVLYFTIQQFWINQFSQYHLKNALHF